MLAWLVGNVDVPAAAVLIAAFGSGAVVVTALIAKWQSRWRGEHQFTIEKLKIDAELKRALYQHETERGYKMKQLEQNLITSHRAE